jgi:serine/threonine protein kinase
MEVLLTGLDESDRRVVELRLQGEELKAIAADTGKSERTVRRTLARVREKLAARLARDGVFLESAPRRGQRPPDLDAPLQYDNYRLQRLIGAGRVGKVYRALQRQPPQTVAVKFLRKSFLRRTDVVQRFSAEARMTASLDHTGIVKVYGLGHTPTGAYFIVMDLVDGSDLDALIRRGPVAVEDAVRWVGDACDAIEHAHQRGIVHCDLKPANLLLDASGRLRVTDFGLARSLSDDGSTYGIEGTAPFMAPEQVSSAWGAIDVRTDVYGLGAVLFTLLSGRPPWQGARLADVLAQVVSATSAIELGALRPELPAPLNEICRRCLSKSPSDRFADVHALRSALPARDAMRHVLG